MKKCDQKGTKRAVATKFVNKKLMKRDQVTHELGILQNLQHPLLVGLLDTFETPTSYVLVLETGSLSCGAREVRSPCAWRGGARPGSRVTGGD